MGIVVQTWLVSVILFRMPSAVSRTSCCTFRGQNRCSKPDRTSTNRYVGGGRITLLLLTNNKIQTGLKFKKNEFLSCEHVITPANDIPIGVEVIFSTAESPDKSKIKKLRKI